MLRDSCAVGRSFVDFPFCATVASARANDHAMFICCVCKRQAVPKKREIGEQCVFEHGVLNICPEASKRASEQARKQASAQAINRANKQANK